MLMPFLSGCCLGNFLSGMETLWSRRFAPAARAPLETSLVEWKLEVGTCSGAAGSPLGNFLSGMETEPMRARQLCRADLGNFLSGMETVGGVVRLQEHLALETSLVEWKLEAMMQEFESALCLGNFLSGMET